MDTFILEKISNSMRVSWRAISSSSISKKLREAEKIFLGTCCFMISYVHHSRKYEVDVNINIDIDKDMDIDIGIEVFLTCGSGVLSSNIIFKVPLGVWFICLESEFCRAEASAFNPFNRSSF